jgi:hypothetical protein
VYRDGALCDALEVLIWKDAEPTADVSALADWFETELAALAK